MTPIKVKVLIRLDRTFPTNPKVILPATSAQITSVALDDPGPPLPATPPKSVGRHMYGVGTCRLTQERALVANTVVMLAMTIPPKRKAAPLPVASAGGVLHISKYDL